MTVTLASEQEFAASKISLNKRITNTPASGLGDDAVYVTVGKLATLAVKKGSVYFFLRVYGLPLDQIKAKEKTFALDVLAKL